MRATQRLTDAGKSCMSSISLRRKITNTTSLPNEIRMLLSTGQPAREGREGRLKITLAGQSQEFEGPL